MPDWRSAPSAASAAPLVAALTEHRSALLEHLHDEEEYILPLIDEHLTVAEWARLGQRFAEEVPKDKMLYFLGAILEDASPAERQVMMANLPAPASCSGASSASTSTAARSARSAAGSPVLTRRCRRWPSVQRFRPGVTRKGPAGPGSRASTAGAGRASHGGEAPWPPRRRSRRTAT